MLHLFSKHVLNWQHNCIPTFSPKKVYFEFGVGIHSQSCYLLAVTEFCKEHNISLDEFHMYGFDSFAGLPHSDIKEDNHKDWIKGQWTSDPLAIKEKVKEYGFPIQNHHLTKGYFEDSLTPQLLQEYQNKNIVPSFVNIDVDYYSSTKLVMEWLYPLLVSGCIFYFDDIWSFHGNPNYGQLKYINEFNASGKGTLTPFNYMINDCNQLYIFSKPEWEYTK